MRKTEWLTFTHLAFASVYLGTIPLSQAPPFVFSVLNELGWLSKVSLLQKVIVFLKIIYFNGSQILVRGPTQIQDKVSSSHYSKM